MSLYFIRHGETDWNAQGRLQGQRDIPLNAKGRGQARTAGEILRLHAPHFAKLDYWASPLLRTRETMEIARNALGLNAPYKTDDRLKELAFGQWEGLTWPEVKAKTPGLALSREQDKWHTSPPEGENYVRVCARVQDFLTLLKHESVVVAHGGIGRVLFHLLGGMGQKEAVGTHVEQGVIYSFNKGKFDILKAT
jgi:broad specificity phosphatase PhoE